jgi:hypothetical protein
MNQCQITFETLVDFYEGRTDTVLTRRLRRHLDQNCAECNRRLEWLGLFMPALHRAVTEETPVVPAAVLASARNIARQRSHKAQEPLLVRMARLVFDSRLAQPAFGARSGNTGDLQQVYSTDENDVDLWQERQTADNWYLIGQVLPKDGGEPITPAEVVLSTPDGRRFTTLPEAEEFTVRDVPPGTYRVRLRLADQEIVLPDVIIGM